MFPGDSHSGRALFSWPALLLAGLGVVFWWLAEPVARLESALHDVLQRVMAGDTAAPVTVVTLDESDPETLWASLRLPELLTAARRAGAVVVIPAEPPAQYLPPAELEKVARLLASEGRPGIGNPARERLLRTQYAEFEARALRQERNTLAVAEAGNVLVGVRVSGSAPSSELAAECVVRLAGLPAGDPTQRSEHLLDAINPGLCTGAAGLVHLEFQPDADGVLRLAPAPLLLREGLVPPASMAAATRLAGTGNDAPDRRGPRFLRYYSGGALAPPFPVLSADEVLAASPGTLDGQVVVIGRPTPHKALPTPLGVDLGIPVLLATAIANEIGGDHLRRPDWLPWLEALLALLIGPVLLIAAPGRAPAQAAAAVLVGAAGMIGLEAAFFATGLWAHLASLALWTAPAVGLALVLGRYVKAAAPAAADAPRPAPPAGGAVNELDLIFSVLRQQPTTEQTKARLYELAMEHGRRRDYARAERVFRHLAGRDPDYRDVREKLERLSGARLALQNRARPAPAAAPAAPRAPEQGHALGRYVLERVIGRGAMATVYLGRDPTINRKVAIKTVALAEEFEESDLANARQHFRREAESSGRLNHPNIIAIYDAGEDGNVAYLAMEYFEGQPLSFYTQAEHLLPPHVVLELMARAAEALHYAHSHNVVHRDVKPANLLYDRGSDTLKLTDFGIARLTDTNRTRTGIILGTPSYMSPEQLTASKVTGQSDLYSLGVTMYHLLTGSPPFQADSIPKLMQRIATEPHRPIRDFRDDVPPCVDAILDRAMAKDPADRFPDGQAMALALRECSASVRFELA